MPDDADGRVSRPAARLAAAPTPALLPLRWLPAQRLPRPPLRAIPAPGPSGSVGPGEVPSPLAGRVTAVVVAAGQEVKEGDHLLTLEAMKMNTFVFAPTSGKIVQMKTAVGDAVEENQVLMRIGLIGRAVMPVSEFARARFKRCLSAELHRLSLMARVDAARVRDGRLDESAGCRFAGCGMPSGPTMQSAGRGRFQRNWVSDEGGFWLSAVVPFQSRFEDGGVALAIGCGL